MQKRVQKRNGRGFETVRIDKITTRILHLCTGLSPDISATVVAMKTINSIYDGINTEELDLISARMAESLKLEHPDYGKLAANILISNLHKMTPKTFSECISNIKNTIDIISPEHYAFIMQNRDVLDDMIIDNNDYTFDYFGYKTLEANYLNKVDEPELDIDGTPVYLYKGDNVRVRKPDEKIYFNRNGKPFIRKQSKIVGTTGKDDRGRSDVATRVCYLDVKTRPRVIDRPQYMFMRVAIAINITNSEEPSVIRTALTKIKQCYKLLSQQYFTHATPTLFNACTRHQQLNSCFLLGTADSIEDIMHTVTNASLISKSAGGIGIHMSNIRSRNSVIKSTNGRSSGIAQQLKIYNETACTWDQGGRRKGAFAIYIEPWHADIMSFLKLKLNQGDESLRARDLFYALWVPDLFVYCARNQLKWSLFSEDTAPGLSDLYDGMPVCITCGHCPNPAYNRYFGECAKRCKGVCNYKPVNAFTRLYTQYEDEGLAIDRVSAAEIMHAIIDMQRESGTPYVLFKDNVNRMSNQMGIGTIKSSNLCTEIMEYSDNESYACCTLASISLKKYLGVGNANTYNHELLHSHVKEIVRNLDIIIDVNEYPVKECIQNSQDYRPIGIGVQGLADVFCMMRIPFLSPEAAKLDLEIFETIYHAAVEASIERAQECGAWTGFKNSPSARGVLAPDLWLENQKHINGILANVNVFSGRYDWDKTRIDAATYGMRNSLLISPMPTVSTSQILGNNESFEPYSANIYTKTTISGKYTVANNHMITHLRELGLWNDSIRMRITNDDGSVQNIPEIPDNIKAIYLTVWEMKQTELMKRAATRAAFVDQSQSLNIYLKSNTNDMFMGVFFYGGEKLGLKTNSYYIRTRPANKAMNNNIAALEALTIMAADPSGFTCDPNGECTVCSS